MKILTIILSLGSILENKVNGENGLDVLKLKPMIENLDNNVLENKKCLENTVTCSGIEYSDCYSKLLEVYEKNIEHDVAKAINESILKKLTSYNDLVLLLFTKIEDSQEELASERISADTLIDYIRFENSNVYCVVDFLRRFGISPNDKLKDSIFFSDPKILNKNNITNFEKLKQLILGHFNPYDGNLRLDQKFIEDNLNSVKGIKLLETFKNLLDTLRQDIINFSIPFCNTQLSQTKEDFWMWKKLQNSTLLSQKLQNSDSLMDWEDLKSNENRDLQAKEDFGESSGTISPSSSLLEDHLSYSLLDLWEISEKTFTDNEDIRKLQDIFRTKIIMPEEETTVDSNEFENFHDVAVEQRLDSLNKMFEKQYGTAKFDQVDTFYNSVITTIDAYVTKVLFCRVLHLVSGILTSYFEVISKHSKSEFSKDEYFENILNFGYELEMFLITLEMYINHEPLTLDRKTISDMHVILVDVRARYFYHIFEIYDPKKSVNIIRTYLKDRRFHRDSNDLKFADDCTSVKNCNELLNNSLDELQLININFVHIIEVKIIPTEA